MCPPAASLSNAVSTQCTDEGFFMILSRITSGSPLPENVCTDVNPYHYLPSNLPGDVWFLIWSKDQESKDTEVGVWKAKGEASKIFSDRLITVWMTTLEFYEGQAPHGRKIDWVMHDYTIKELCESSKETEVGTTLCRVLSGDEQSPNHIKKLKISSSMLASENCIHPSYISNADYNAGASSTSKSNVDKDNKTGNTAVTGRVVNDPLQNLPNNNYFSRGDYLELLDLDMPASPSSCSEISSCLTMSSDECFDSLALLQELEPENNHAVVPEDTGLKFSISTSLKPTEVVMSPATLGPLVMSMGGNKSQRIVHDDAASSSSSRTGEEKKSGSGCGKKKKLTKYLCFIPC